MDMFQIMRCGTVTVPCMYVCLWRGLGNFRAEGAPVGRTRFVMSDLMLESVELHVKALCWERTFGGVVANVSLFLSVFYFWYSSFSWKSTEHMAQIFEHLQGQFLGVHVDAMMVFVSLYG